MRFAADEVRGVENIETEVWKYLVTQGPFAVLFVWLLIYVMRQNERRENRLNDILEKFSEKYDVIIDELREIKGRLRL